MAGARRKNPNALAGHRGTTVVRLVKPSAPAPLPSRGWWKTTKDDWALFWSSSVAGQVDRDVDMPELREMFDAMDELRRCTKAFRSSPMVRGSMGQLVMNPVGRRIDTLRHYLLAVRTRFGADPLSRARLGWTAAEGATAAERLRRMMGAEEEPPDDGAMEGEWEPL